MPCTTYTYQGGERLELSCSTTHFVSRAKKEQLEGEEFSLIHPLSPHSWCVRTSPERLHEDLVRARLLGPAYPAYVVAGSGAGFHVTDRIALRFRRNVTDTEARQFGVHADLEVVKHLTPRDVLFRVPDDKDAIDVVRNLTELHLDDVELVDHDLNIRPQLQEAIAAEPDAAEQQWHLLSTIANPLVQTCALLDCEGAWKETCGEGVVIGVVDSGCDLTDPNFGGLEKFVDWAVLLDGELLTSKDLLTDPNGSIMNPPRVHGTLCATLVAASAARHSGVGVAPDCRLLPVKWQALADGKTAFSESLFLDIIHYLRDKVDVVSLSWTRGAGKLGRWPKYIVEALEDAALHGGPHGNGIVWVWAAGNRNCPIRYSGDIEVPIVVAGNGAVKESSREFVNPFVGLPGVVHVGAISSFGQRCHYSNYGEGLDLVAPSGNKHTYGRGEVRGIPLYAPLEHGLYHFRGTSAATPLVAGVAALVRAVNPKLTSEQIVSVLRQTADKDLDFTGYDPSSRPTDPNPAWDVSPIEPYRSGKFDREYPDGTWSPWFGFGKVNARAAVARALELRQKQL